MTSTAVPLPPTEGRVPLHAYERHNRKVTDDAIVNLHRYARAAPSEVTRRLGYLAKVREAPDAASPLDNHFDDPSALSHPPIGV